jgi:hypothetical protein
MLTLSEIAKTIVDIIRNKGGRKNAIRGIIDATGRRTRSRSIKSRVRDFILQFPVLVSSAMSKDSVFLITKAIERENASLIELLLTNNAIYDVDHLGKGEDMTGVLKKYHKNDDLGRNIPDFFIKENKNLLFSPTEDLKLETLNEMTISWRFLEAKSISSGSLSAGKEKEMGTSVSIFDSDIDKANELQPTIMKVSVIYKKEGITEPIEGHLTFGIKSVAHLIPSDEMVYFVSRGVKEGNIAFRIIQWTTGEIRLFRDLIFNIDRIKKEANVSNSKTSKWWHWLRTKAGNARINSIFTKNNMMPTATLVLTMEEVDYIKNKSLIDLTHPKHASKLINTYFLLGFIIMDEADEVAWIWNDQQNTFTHHSYAALKKEGGSSMSSDIIKAMVNLASK